MAKVTYVPVDQAPVTLDVPEGISVMQAAVNHGLRGILADCGGQCQCATCHVYVEEQFLDRLPEMSEDEDEMLDVAAADRRDNSRLSCQLSADVSLDGLVVHLPETQR